MVNPLRAVLVAAVLSLLLPSLSPAQAEPNVVVRMTPPQAASFAGAFTELSRQAHVMIVAEDQPLHTALTPGAAAELKLNKDGEPLSALLPKLADAYDYDVQPSGKAFVLKKRYTDAADLPSITVKECALGLAEISRYAESFNPHVPLDEVGKTSVISDLIYSLTPEQLEAMGDNKRGVPVSSLSAIQQEEVQQFVLFFYVQRALRDLPDTLTFLNRTAADPKFGWHFFPQMNARLFGYDSPSGYQGFQILSKPDQVKARIGFGLEITRGTVEGEATAAADAYDDVAVVHA